MSINYPEIGQIFKVWLWDFDKSKFYKLETKFVIDRYFKIQYHYLQFLHASTIDRVYYKDIVNCHLDQTFDIKQLKVT